jgi:hypothetical protein
VCGGSVVVRTHQGHPAYPRHHPPLTRAGAAAHEKTRATGPSGVTRVFCLKSQRFEIVCLQIVSLRSRLDCVV